MGMVTTLITAVVVIIGGIFVLNKLQASGKLQPQGGNNLFGGNNNTNNNKCNTSVACPTGYVRDPGTCDCLLKQDDDKDNDDDDNNGGSSSGGCTGNHTKSSCEQAWGDRYTCSVGKTTGGKCYCDCRPKAGANLARAFTTNINSPQLRRRRAAIYNPAILQNHINRDLQNIYYKLRLDYLPQNLEFYRLYDVREDDYDQRMNFIDLYKEEDPRPYNYVPGERNAITFTNRFMGRISPIPQGIQNSKVSLISK